MSKIIDPNKLKKQELEDEFVQRLNSLAQNALWRGLTRIEVVGLLDTFKTGIQLQSFNLKSEPPKEKG